MIMYSNEDVDKLREELVRLRAQCDCYRKALEFYADTANYTIHSRNFGRFGREEELKITWPFDKARTALEDTKCQK